MNVFFTTKYLLKSARWQGRRLAVALRWGPANLQDTPTVLGNAMPKSGSHLINQVVQGLVQLGPFVNSGFRQESVRLRYPTSATASCTLRNSIV